MIEIDDVSVRFRGRRRHAVNSVSAVVPDGSVVALLGRNGAGKTTLLRTVAGIQTPTSGSVRVDGLTHSQLSRPAEHIGVHLGLTSTHRGHSARRFLRMVAHAAGCGSDSVEAVIEQTELVAVADRRISAFSLGMRQRLGIAVALLGRPRHLILDEPVNGLDIDGIFWLRNLIADTAASGRTVLLASHHLAEVHRTADRIIVVDDGRIVADESVENFTTGYRDVEDAFCAATSAPA